MSRPLVTSAQVPKPSHQRGAHLGLLGGLDDDAVGGVVEFPGNDTKKLRLVFVTVIIRRADTDELSAERREINDRNFLSASKLQST